MRIAFVAGFALNRKGTVRARALPLAAELVRLGHEVTVFLTPYDNLGDAGREWVQDGVRIRNMGDASMWPNGRSWAKYSAYGRMLRQLTRELSRYAPDLIHVFKPKGFAGAAGSYFLTRGSYPITLDCDDWEGWGGWNEVKPYPWLVKEYIDRQERWMIRRAPAVTVASRALEGRAAKLRGGREGIYYIPNCSTPGIEAGVRDQNRSQVEIRQKFGLPAGPIVFYSGHFDAGEDASFFCRAAAKVMKEHSASIVFVGAGPELSRVKDFFGAHPDVKTFFFPPVSRDEFLGLVWASDVAAFPYRDDPIHRAKCSARIADYMAMGKAVLTSAVGENHEYIVDGESGMLAKPDDEQDFAVKLQLLLKDPRLRNRLGENARERIRSKFTWDGAAVQQCLAAYQHVLNRKTESKATPARCPESFS